jgi:hypothetical protein
MSEDDLAGHNSPATAPDASLTTQSIATTITIQREHRVTPARLTAIEHHTTSQPATAHAGPTPSGGVQS